MGSPLGPTMADYFMAELENRLLSDDKISNPIMYVRYVDDTLCIFKNKSHVHHFKSRLQRASKLNFTHESMQNGQFNFLDVSLTLLPNGKFNTAVYIKPTDKGLYTNFQSHAPEQYKKSIINSLVSRAIKISSTDEHRDIELRRLTQVLVNNGYPQCMIESIIRKKIQTSHDEPDSTNGQNDSQRINLYVQLFNVHEFRRDTKKLQNIANQHIVAMANEEVKIISYYKPYKLSGKFSTRKQPETPDKSCLVYQFNCPEASCHDSQYIGFTNQRFSTRVKQHRQKSSSIYKHYIDVHNEVPPKFDTFFNSFKIIFSCNDLLSIKIAEAIFIKSVKPIINVKYNEFYDFLRLF